MFSDPKYLMMCDNGLLVVFFFIGYLNLTLLLCYQAIILLLFLDRLKLLLYPEVFLTLPYPIKRWYVFLEYEG